LLKVGQKEISKQKVRNNLYHTRNPPKDYQYYFLA
jgi:hypothetical protein